MPQTLSLASYLDSYGHTLTLVNYLTQELSSHPQLKEIPLLGETGGLTISSDAAWEVVLSYLRDNNLPSNYLELLENPRLAKQKKLEVVLDFLQNQESELPLANLAIEKNLAAYRTSLEAKAKALDPSSPLQKAFAIQHAQIKKYHESLHVLQGTVFGTTTAEQLTKRAELAPLLPPPEILSDDELKLVQEQLVSLLPSLASSAELSSSPKPEAIYKALSAAATKNTTLSKFVVFNASDDQKAHLAAFVDSTAKEYTQKTGQSLVKLEQTQRSITSDNLGSLALPRVEAEKVLVSILTDRGLMSTHDATTFASQLFTESVRSAYTANRTITAEDLVAAALSKFSISPNSPEAHSLSEAVSPLFSDLLVHNQTQILEARRLGYVPGPIPLPKFLFPAEVKLALSTNTDPALLSINPDAALKRFLKQYGVKDLAVLRALAIDNNNIPLLSELSLLENYQTQLSRFKSSLNPFQQLSVGYIRTKNALGRGVFSYQQITTKAWNKLFKFQEKLDHLNPITRVTNWWIDAEAKIMDTNWGWALNPAAKAYQVFDAWREKAVTKILQKYKLNPPKNLGGRFVNWATQMYYQGGFTFSGFATQTVHWVARKVYDYAVKGAKKLGGIILKKAATFAIKILGEAAVEQILGSVIPVIGNVLGIIATVADIVKTLWQNREAIVDIIKKGAVYVAAIGFALWSFLAALFTKIGSALLGATLGATVGLFAGGPIGALVGGVIGGVAGYLATNIAAVVASVASYASAMMSALAAAASSIATFVVGIIGVTYFTALIIITATTTAEIPTAEIPGHDGSNVIFEPGNVVSCEGLGQEITSQLAAKIDKGTIKFLPDNNYARSPETRHCIEPTAIVIHWSGGRDDDLGNDATYNTLISRVIEMNDGTSRNNVLACQLASDTDDVMFMQPFFEKGVEMSQCAGNANPYSINIEISGANFLPTLNPPKEIIFNRSIEIVCLLMKQYNIGIDSIIGHYEVPNSGKSDPGKAFLQEKFKPTLDKQCK